MSPDMMVSIVDDDPDIRDSLAMLLQSEGIPTREFASAEDFLANGLADHSGCVLADIRMPGMDGFALLGMIAARQLTIPVIMMTGHGDVPMAVSAMKQGASDFIQKPIDAEALLSFVWRFPNRTIRHRPRHLILILCCLNVFLASPSANAKSSNCLSTATPTKLLRSNCQSVRAPSKFTAPA